MSDNDLTHGHIAFEVIAAAFPDTRIDFSTRLADLPLGARAVPHLHHKLEEVFTYGLPDVDSLRRLATIHDVIVAVVQGVAAEQRKRTAAQAAGHTSLLARAAAFVKSHF